MGVDQQGNAVLGALLGELDWSPSLLAEAVTGLLGPGSVARSTVSEWLHHDRLPREPLPTVVAHLISDTLDREVCFDELWSGRARPAEFWVPADAGLRLPWTAAGTVEVLNDWLRTYRRLDRDGPSYLPRRQRGRADRTGLGLRRSPRRRGG